MTISINPMLMVLHRGRERAINIYAFCTCEHTFMHISFEMLYSLSSSYHWWEGVRGVWERGRARLKQLIFFSRNWLSSLLAKTLVPRMLAIHICSYDLCLFMAICVFRHLAVCWKEVGESLKERATAR